MPTDRLESFSEQGSQHGPSLHAHTEKKVNNAAVTVNSNKLSSNPTLSNGGSKTGDAATSALVATSWDAKWIANLTDVIGISNQVIKDQTKRK